MTRARHGGAMRIPRSPIAVALSATALVGAGAAGGALASGGDPASAAPKPAAARQAQPCAARMAKRLSTLAGRLDVVAGVRTAVRDARKANGGQPLTGSARRAAAKPVLDQAVKAGKLKPAREDKILDRLANATPKP